MIIFKKAADVQQYLEQSRQENKTIGFVPTMGALHDGHLSLIQASKTETGLTVSSIFVNPTQFNDPKDFEKYPITLEPDIYKLEQNNCDVLFLPPLKEIYPGGIELRKHYDLGYLDNILEGAYRPGHFQGVCAVVEKLLLIVQPTILYLGQKDYQQYMVIKRLVELMNSDQKPVVKFCPIVREKDGLAMSSRNMRLNEEEREKATTIFKALEFLENNIDKDSLSHLKERAKKMLEEAGFKVDYVEIARAENLQPVKDLSNQSTIIALIAAYLNEIRLIDNMILRQ
jgi:pantoate--beta-alanine ligase